MIDQVLTEIKLAEEKATEIRQKADEEAKQINKQGETEASLIVTAAEEKAKEIKKEYKLKTAQKVDKLYAEVLKDAEEDSDALFQSLQAKINQLSDEVLKKVLNGDC